MNREEILETLERFETETKLKAWSFRIDKKFYQVAEYGGVYRVPVATSIWETNKRGKRLGEKIFTISKQDHIECIKLFLDKLEEAKIEEELKAESKSEN
jgi:hypothetical protein